MIKNHAFPLKAKQNISLYLIAQGMMILQKQKIRMQQSSFYFENLIIAVIRTLLQ